MAINRDVSRRAFFATLTATMTIPRLALAAEGSNVPTIAGKVEKLYKVPSLKQPNDMQFTAEGLWVLDQVDPNKVFLLRPEDGKVLRELQTESIHGSGITYGNGALWITSTKMLDPKTPPRTLKVDPKTGKTLNSWVTPGSGYYGNVRPEGGSPSGAHGIKWVDGKYWMAVPAASKIFLMEPETGQIVRSIPGPGNTQRTHGLAWDKGMLWCVNSDDRAIYKMDPKDGRVVSMIQLSKEDPAPHGLDIDNKGVLWYCDAGSSWICKLA
jgi:streptogramin lyase